MRILHIITSLYIGGAEKLMVDLLPRLRVLGNDVELLLFDGTRTPFYDQIEQMGIKIHYLATGGNVYNILNLFRLMKFIKKYDIVHTHNTACQYYVALAKLFSLANYKLFTTEHSTNNRRRKYKIFKLVDKFIYRKYNGIISISTKATESLNSFIGHNINIFTIENGINITKFSKLKQTDFSSHDKIITMIAGFREAKDQDTLIQAIKLLPNDYKLWLVGDGQRREILENIVAELNLTNRVKFWGIRSDIPQILEQTHVVVLSSHWEGFGLAAVEAMASARPTIVSNVDGLREIVKGYGILFPSQDSVSLANEIKSLCENQEKYNQIASACQKRAKQFDINIMAKKYNQLYHNVIS